MPIVVSGTSWADLPGVSLTADSEAVGLGVSALRTPVLGEVWRTGPPQEGSPRTLNVDLGQAVSIAAVVLEAPRDGLLPEPGATIQAMLSVSASGDSDAGMTAGPFEMRRGYWGWVLPAAVSARYLRIAMNSAQPYLQFGRLWLASGLLAQGNVGESGYEPGAADEVGRPTRRRLSITMPALSEAEADELEGIGLAAGTQRQVLVIPRTDRASQTAIIGKFTAIPAPRPRQAWVQGGRVYTASLTVEEDR